MRREGNWTDYDDQLNLRVRRGRRLRGIDLDLGHPRHAQELDRIARAAEWTGSVQVGIPSDLDMALFTLGPTGPLRHRGAFTDATTRHITEIRQQLGDRAVFQLEAPAEQVVVIKTPAVLRGFTAAWCGRGLARLARPSPVGTRFGLHLCLGDLGHRALAGTPSTAPLVTLTNAVARAWPAGRRLEFVHLPLAAGHLPPTLDPAFHAPLAGLRLPVGTRVVAGFLHEELTDEQCDQLLATVEDAVGATVDVAASCGLGRRSVAAAETTLAQGARLCSLPVSPEAEAF